MVHLGQSAVLQAVQVVVHQTLTAALVVVVMLDKVGMVLVIHWVRKEHNLLVALEVVVQVPLVRNMATNLEMVVLVILLVLVGIIQAVVAVVLVMQSIVVFMVKAEVMVVVLVVMLVLLVESVAATQAVAVVVQETVRKVQMAVAVL
jgi:hypothetical protein